MEGMTLPLEHYLMLLNMFSYLIIICMVGSASALAGSLWKKNALDAATVRDTKEIAILVCCVNPPKLPVQRTM